MKIQPLGERVLLKRTEKEKETKSGILLITTDERKQNFAVVVEVSPSITDLTIGDKVIFENFGTETIVNEETEEEFILIETRRILAKFL